MIKYRPTLRVIAATSHEGDPQWHVVGNYNEVYSRWLTEIAAIRAVAAATKRR